MHIIYNVSANTKYIKSESKDILTFEAVTLLRGNEAEKLKKFVFLLCPHK